MSYSSIKSDKRQEIPVRAQQRYLALQCADRCLICRKRDVLVNDRTVKYISSTHSTTILAILNSQISGRISSPLNIF